MAFGGPSKKGALQAAINVTPLVDVVLVLLIIFMVVTPMLSRGKEVALPQSLVVEPGEQERSAPVLTIMADRSLWLDAHPLQQSELRPRLLQLFAKRRDHTLLLKADATLSVADLRPILRTLKTAELRQLSFVVAEPTGAAP